MNIGKMGDDLQGELHMTAPRISRRIGLERIEHDDDPGDKAPTHRIVTWENGNTIEYGAAWQKSKDGRTYYSCEIDQPAWPQPLSFAIFPAKSGGYDIIWSRKKAVA